MDREKVIKGLERCKLYNKVNCDKCPYDYNGRGNGKSECTAELATDALELLKEQHNEITMMKMVYGDYGKIVGELVRCKDCVHRNTGNWCNAHMEHYKDENWFCADGVAKE